MDYCFVSLVGLIVGSFLNVCIIRISKEESIVYPPSHCRSCNHKLRFFDLIPLFSFIFLGGHCRYCKEKISVMYPCIECLNSLLYLLVYNQYGFSLYSLKYFMFASVLIVIAAIDFNTQYIYTNTIIAGTIIGIIFIAIEKIVYKISIHNYIYGAILGALIIAAIVFFTKGMGSGDIEVAMLCGLFLGVRGVIIALFLAIVIGGLIGLLSIAFEIKGFNEKIAFGPFLSIGSIISLLYGTRILVWYLNLFI